MADSGAARFLAATAHLGIEPRRIPQSTHTAADAAAAVDCPVGAIVKSLVFVAVSTPEPAAPGEPTASSDEVREPILALVCGDNRCDTAALAAVLGVRIEKADAATVKRATGYSIGGVPPLGHPDLLRTVIDADLMRFDTVWSAAGSAYDVFAAQPDELVRWTSGTVAAIGTR